MFRGLSLLLLTLWSVTGTAQWRGGDLSFLPRMEEAGYTYRDATGAPIDDVPAWMTTQGMNLARYRIWNDPADGPHHALPDVLREAQRMHAVGMDILLDFISAIRGPIRATVALDVEGPAVKKPKAAMVCWVHCVMDAFPPPASTWCNWAMKPTRA